MKNSIIEKIQNSQKANDDLLLVGQPATYGIGSDSYPLTVIEVKGEVGKRQVTLRSCNSTPTKNHDYYNNQKYLYTENPDGSLYYIKEQHLVNRYEGSEFLNETPRETYKCCGINPETGRLNVQSCGRITIGVRSKYMDPSF